MKKNGVVKDHLILHQGKPSARYDDTCDGTWVLMTEVSSPMAWDSGGSNVFETSQLADFLVWGDLYSAYEPHIQAALHSAVVPYRAGGGLNGSDRTGSSGFACTFFPLSAWEVGAAYSGESSGAPRDGDKLDYFETGNGDTARQKRKFDGQYWLRSMSTTNSIEAWSISATGNLANQKVTLTTVGVLYAFILDKNLWVDEDGTILPNQAPAPPASLTVPPFAEAGAALSLSWPAAADPDGDVTGYLVQRQTNGTGEWAQVYDGPALTCADTVPTGAKTVQYRVRAYDSLGITSDFKTSATLTVYGSTTISIPSMAVEGKSIAISWTAVAGATGYTLQRKTASTDWAQVYSGAGLQYTDTAGAWTSVQYRVRAVFSAGGGAWVTSNSIQVLPESTLSISGRDGSLGTLTNDVAFSVSTDTGNKISVSVSVNGALFSQSQVDSLQEQRIPVMDLPSGAGSILITATVAADPEPVTETRTWTYAKAAPAFPAAGSVARLTQNGKSLFPLTLPEAVRTPAHMGGDLGRTLDALFRLPPAVRPNLLDNPYFAGGGTGWGVFPVNQRGQTSYPNSGRSIDRWMLADGSLEFTASGVRIASTTRYNNNFYQSIYDWDQFVGQTMTVSVLVESVSGGTVVLGINNAGGAQITGPGLYQKTFTVTAAVNRAISLAMNPGTSIVVNAMKLELGEGQTLAYQKPDGAWEMLPQPDMDYPTQLLKCQAYLQLYSTAEARPAKAIDCRPVMRRDPTPGTLVIGGATCYINSAE